MLKVLHDLGRTSYSVQIKIVSSTMLHFQNSLSLVSNISSRHSQALYANCTKNIGMLFAVKWMLKTCQVIDSCIFEEFGKVQLLVTFGHCRYNVIIVITITIGTMVKGLLPPRLWKIFTGVQHTVFWLLLIWWGSRTHCFYIDPILEVRHIYIS